MRTLAVVYNPRSGAATASDSNGAVEHQLTEMFTRRGIDPVLVQFDPQRVGDDVQSLIAHAPDAVIAAGGDGTITSVATQLIGKGVPLGVLPLGTMNVLAVDLGLPADPEAALGALLAGEVRPIDVMRVNGTPFLCASAIALLPHLGRLRERTRGRSGWRMAKMLVRGVEILRRFPRIRLHVVVDGREHVVRTRALVVSNNPFSSEPAPFPKRASLDSGQLGIYVIRDRSRWDLVMLATKLRDGSWLRDRRLRTYFGAEAQVHTSGLGLVSVMNDGEAIQLEMPLRYEIEPKALAVLSPAATR
ncbi:MAG TPA: diacylglycerol kinase family protein [Actinopolymorphaceae bacterium]|jgi:diacylglycerol kinase family enzyme